MIIVKVRCLLRGSECDVYCGCFCAILIFSKDVTKNTG